MSISQAFTRSRSLTLALLVIGLALVAPTSASAEAWVKVETITLNGITNCLPGGAAIGRSYPAGTYQFSLLTSPGIKYRGDWPAVTSAFVMVVEDGDGAGTFHSIGLSVDDGNTKAIVASGAQVNAQFFVQDTFNGDNSGTVKILVRKRQ